MDEKVRAFFDSHLSEVNDYIAHYKAAKAANRRYVQCSQSDDDEGARVAAEERNYYDNEATRIENGFWNTLRSLTGNMHDGGFWEEIFRLRDQR